MARIDDAIAAWEKVEEDGLAGKFSDWSAYQTALQSAVDEYKAAMRQIKIRPALEFAAEQRARLAAENA